MQVLPKKAYTMPIRVVLQCTLRLADYEDAANLRRVGSTPVRSHE